MCIRKEEIPVGTKRTSDPGVNHNWKEIIKSQR